MSRFVSNLLSGGYKLHNQFQFRGASSSVRLEFPLPRFVQRLVTKEKQCLFRTGRTMLRSYKKVLGKRRPTKFTTTGRKSARWRREVEQGLRHRYPYRVTGVLREGTEFVVNESDGTVIAGPYKIDGVGDRVSSSKPVPQLLNEGGSARVRTRRRMLNVQYRALPYKQVPALDGVKQLNKSLSEIPL